MGRRGGEEGRKRQERPEIRRETKVQPQSVSATRNLAGSVTSLSPAKFEENSKETR